MPESLRSAVCKGRCNFGANWRGSSHLQELNFRTWFSNLYASTIQALGLTEEELAACGAEALQAADLHQQFHAAALEAVPERAAKECVAVDEYANNDSLVCQAQDAEGLLSPYAGL